MPPVTQNTKSWLRVDWFKLVIAVSALVVAGSLFYYYVVRPQQTDNCRRTFLVFWEGRVEGCDPRVY